MMSGRLPSLVGFLCALVICARTSEAQVVRGTVSDSASRRPIPGAVLILFDSAGVVLGRNITNERGQYTLAGVSSARRLRVQRIGFRPRDVRIPAATNNVVELSVAMIPLPTFLEPIHVTASACPKRSDQGSALALLEQARAGLLTTVVAREAKPASLVLYLYERTMDGTSDKIDRQTVRVDSAYRIAVSFSAVHDAAAFVRRGFMQDGHDGQTFYAPDADVLLADAFANGYCFRVMEPRRERPNQVGLGFVAADRRRDRVDIDGALWIDTVARALRDIEFRYVGLDPRLERFEPGGQLSFQEMPNGTVMVDRWALRLIGTQNDTLNRIEARRSAPNIRTSFYVHESGGELAHAVWRDSLAWHGTLGTLDARVLTRGGQSARGVQLWLKETPYRARSDSVGRFTMRDLVPGAYSLVREDSALTALHLTIPTDLWFMSKRDTTRVAIKVPSLDEWVVDRCLADRSYRYSLSDTTRILARVLTPDGKPVGDAHWRLSISPPTRDGPENWTVVRDGGQTGTDGMLQVCQQTLIRGAMAELTVWHPSGARTTVRRRLSARVNTIPITLDIGRK